MVQQMQFLAILAALAVAEAVTPVEKVTSLLEDLKKSVEDEGKAEATTYDTFACFCKDTTTAKSKSITESQDKIDSTTADIGSKTANKKGKITKLGNEQQKVEETTVKLQETTATYQKDKTEYEATSADLTKAISSIKKALTSLKNSKSAALLSIGDRSDVRNVLDLGEALNLVQPSKTQAVAMFLQRVDPNDPDYKFHSGKIIGIIEDLDKDFKAKKSDLQAEWKKTDDSYKNEKKDMEGIIDTAKAEIKTLTGDIDKLSADIAKARGDLVNAESSLTDDSAYLKDLTTRCEQKAQSWDQRSSTRADEVKALTQALKIIKDQVTDADKVNKRAALVAKTAPAPPAKAAMKAAAPAAKAVPAKPVAKKAEAVASKPVAAAAKPKAKSFLQAISRIQLLSAKGQDRAVELLSHEGARLKSVMLSSLVAQIKADPFGKVKTLIQGLIERLLNESKQEATKKGFCDTELGKSKLTRDQRFSEINKIDAELSELEAHQNMLDSEIVELGKSVTELNAALTTATDLRKDEKTENANTVKTATDGAKAVGEALVVLRDFYKTAAKAAFVQTAASPVDEDDPGAGFEGPNKGSQGSSKAILGLLETIKTDFERTVRSTEDAEAKAHEEFILFQRTSKSDIAGKEMKESLDKQDLASTKTGIQEGMKDLKTATDLMDGALKNIEDLKPTCIDSGMSYAERVQKREEEIKALKSAVCMLDAEKVEPECQ